MQVLVNGARLAGEEACGGQDPVFAVRQRVRWDRGCGASAAVLGPDDGAEMAGDLEALARRVNPLKGTLLGRMQYYRVTAQCEYATDVTFKSEAALKELYPKLISHSALCFGAKEIMGVSWEEARRHVSRRVCERPERAEQPSTRSRYRLGGMRIKHRVKVNWIKMYDKAGSVLRVEMVINDPTAFKVRKHVRRRRSRVTLCVEMRKGVANLFRRT
jgi:hypothetical protein